MNSQVVEPVPDEYCPHVESESAEMVGGWVFSANIPPLAVGMCRKCLNWCHDNLSQPQTWSDYVENQYAEADKVLSARVIEKLNPLFHFSTVVNFRKIRFMDVYLPPSLPRTNHRLPG